MTERKFYETHLDFYVNGIEVYNLALTNLYYGYPKCIGYIPQEIKDVNELHRILSNLNLGYKVKKGFRKVKIFGVFFKKKDIKEIKIIQRQVDNSLFIGGYKVKRLLEELTIDEFTQFCIDNGLTINPNK